MFVYTVLFQLLKNSANKNILKKKKCSWSGAIFLHETTMNFALHAHGMKPYGDKGYIYSRFA